MCGCDDGAEPQLRSEASRRSALRGGLLGLMSATAATALAGTSATAASTAPQPDRRRLAEHELITLGTLAGPVASARRSGIATAIVSNGRTYLVDCGLGSLSNFARAGLTLPTLSALLVTHMHADHVIDYPNFLVYGGKLLGRDVDGFTVYGPGRAGGMPEAWDGEPKPTVGGDEPTPGILELTEAALNGNAYSINMFLRSGSPNRPRTEFDVREIELPPVGSSYQDTAPPTEPFDVFDDGNVKVTATLVKHYNIYPSFAFRFDLSNGRSIVLSGDTVRSENVIRLANDCDVLVHESIYRPAGSDEEPKPTPQNPKYHTLSHTYPDEVGEVATAAGARKLVLSHIAPDVTPDRDCIAAVSTTYRGPITVARDLQRFSLD